MKQCLQFFILAIFFLCSPIFAIEDTADDDTGRDDTIVLHVYDDIDLISTVKYQYVKPKISIKSVYPQLQSDSDNPSVTDFNQLVVEKIQEKSRRFIQEVKENQANQKRLPAKTLTNELYIDFDTATINPKDNQIISIRFSIQSYMAGMAHPAHQHEVLNYNMETGKLIALEDLFQENADYLTVLSAYAEKILNKRLTNKLLLASGITPIADHFKNWNIKPNSLLITFEEGQVAPYIYGSQTILIPYTALKEIISPDSPINYCLARKKHCAGENLLTGGFIDSVGA